jgi:hypothetical protein
VEGSESPFCRVLSYLPEKEFSMVQDIFCRVDDSRGPDDLDLEFWMGPDLGRGQIMVTVHVGIPDLERILKTIGIFLAHWQVRDREGP